jgi:hypothetical protein
MVTACNSSRRKHAPEQACVFKMVLWPSAGGERLTGAGMHGSIKQAAQVSVRATRVGRMWALRWHCVDRPSVCPTEDRCCAQHRPQHIATKARIIVKHMCLLLGAYLVLEAHASTACSCSQSSMHAPASGYNMFNKACGIVAFGRSASIPESTL